mmetsp:Transcript_10269/g.22246  ORF Transcript_10269/g.22246 Transcript_10269/m.22246 type:complete len:223 (-) Transcript_10269:30-698(-)
MRSACTAGRESARTGTNSASCSTTTTTTSRPGPSTIPTTSSTATSRGQNTSASARPRATTPTSRLASRAASRGSCVPTLAIATSYRVSRSAPGTTTIPRTPSTGIPRMTRSTWFGLPIRTRRRRTMARRRRTSARTRGGRRPRRSTPPCRRRIGLPMSTTDLVAGIWPIRRRRGLPAVVGVACCRASLIRSSSSAMVPTKTTCVGRSSWMVRPARILAASGS